MATVIAKAELNNKELMEFEKLYENIIINVNKILGLAGGDDASIQFLSSFPIKFSIIKEDKSVAEVNPDGKIALQMSAYTRFKVMYELYIDILVYSDQKIVDVLKLFNREHKLFLSYIYLHEIQHIIRLHITEPVKNIFKRIIKSEHPELLKTSGKYQIRALINSAEDYAINWALKEIEQASKQKCPELFEQGLYDEKYHRDRLDEYEIFRILLKDTPAIKIEPLDEDQDGQQQSGQGSQGQGSQGQSSQGQGSQGQSSQGQGSQGQSSQGQGSQGQGQGGQKVKVTMTWPNGSVHEEIVDTSKLGEEQNQCQDTTNAPEASARATALAQAQKLAEITKNAAQRGVGSAAIETLIPEVPVNVDWLNDLKKSFNVVVKYNAQDYYSDWKNLNNKMRHIAKFPSQKRIENKLNLYLSVDQSGSMSDEELGKLLSLIKQLRKKIKKIVVIIHDYEIVKLLEYNKTDIPSVKDIKKILGTRYAAGGTSHAPVFQYLDSIKIDPDEKPIYVSFSDNWSDIEENWNNFKNKKLFAGIYFITTDKLVNIPGVKQFKI